MRQFGTDVMAVACIVGGGLVAGGITLALARDADRASLERPSMECLTTAGQHDPNVMVSVGGEGVVVVRPDVRVRAVKECIEQQAVETASSVREDVEREVEEARREIERARREADRVRERVDQVRERVDRVRGRDVARVRRVQQEQIERARERLQDARFEIRTRDGERHEIHFDGLEDFDFDFDHDFDFDFDFDFDEMEFEFEFEGLEGLDGTELHLEGLEEALQLELQALEGLEIEFEELDEERRAEIERRIEEAMEELRDRLERVGNEIGR